jgi:hypothetical protein
MKKISRKTAKALEKIAMSASYSLEYRGGIDERNNDSEDFPEVSVWALRKMLQQAYLLGRSDGEGKR